MDNYNFEKKFNGQDFCQMYISGKEFDTCTFINCNFSKAHLATSTFLECEFIDCDFSNTDVKNASFKTVYFQNCKMIGINFNECTPFMLALKFKDCNLNVSSFYRLSIPNTSFINCNLEETDFAETNLKGSTFNNCNLKLAIFENSNLEKVNFKTSFSFSIDPEKNHLKKAKFSKENLIGLLQKHQIIVDS